MAVLAAILAGSFLLSPATAVKCPYTGALLPTDYADVRTSPVEKYVGKSIMFTITDVWKDGSKTPADNRLIIIYYIIDEEVVSEYDIYTDSSGVARFAPGDSGRYAVATSNRYIFFDVLARCGDDLCTYGETRIGCPVDCSKCGDDVCDVGETKENCPKDCVVCGDDSCDVGENRMSCPADCARCGDGVCDINENKIGCPEDCVICGDDVCDYLELVSLHETTCPQDCNDCGDGYCDVPENAENCPEDCIACGDNKCEGGENETCPEDCNVCGDEKCDYDENKTTCPDDCVICGDDICDAPELTALHESSCPQDCATCGDGYCDAGESSFCDSDCKDKIQGLFAGYFLIPLIIVIVVIIFEVAHHFATSRHPSAKEAAAAAKSAKKARAIELKKLEPTTVLPYLFVFAFGLILTSILIAFLGLDYGKNLAILDMGNYLLGSGPIISLMVISLAAGMGLLARATYYMERAQALSLTIGFSVMGLVPGLFIFLNLEYLVLMIGMLVGIMAATLTIKKEETEYVVVKSFRIGSDAADKTLTIAAIFACVLVFMQLYLGADTSDQLSASIWNSQVSKAAVKESFGPQADEAALKDNVVEPLLSSRMGGFEGRLIFAMTVAVILFIVLKLFIIITKLLAGFFSWMLDKSGFVE